MNEIDGYSAQQLQQLRDREQEEHKFVSESQEKSESESDHDLESDDDDEDPVMMQDWTKRIEQEMLLKMCQVNGGVTLIGEQDLEAKVEEEDDSDEEFEGRRRPQKKVGSIEALLKKQESASSDKDETQLYSTDMQRRAQAKLKAKPPITCCLYETNMKLAA